MAVKPPEITSVKISEGPFYEDFRQALLVAITDPKTVWPREFIEEIIRLRKGNPKDPHQIVQAFCRFYDHHSEPSGSAGEFLVKCDAHEEWALRKISYQQDPIYMGEVKRVNRRYLIKKAAITVAGIVSLGGTIASGRAHAKEEREIKNSTPDQSAEIAQRVQMHEAVATDDAIIALTSMIAAVFIGGSLAQELRMQNDAEADHSNRKEPKKIVLKLLEDTNTLIESAGKILAKKEKAKNSQPRL